MTATALTPLLRQRRIWIAVGPGGVGKTTVSASLALGAAVSGRPGLVCTIDPARRLANALGLQQLGSLETQLPPEALAQAGVAARSTLSAMMLDMRQTWDELITANAPQKDQRRIFQSRFYRTLSTVLAGSQEYIAMEKLCQLRGAQREGLIVLDTPPSEHARDFLSAPKRVLDFLENDAARLLLAPMMVAGRVGLRFFQASSGFLARALTRFTGAETLQELADFLQALRGMESTFRARARQVNQLLADAGTAFILVTGAEPERRAEVLAFHAELLRSGFRVDAVVVNRVHPPVSAEAFEAATRLPEHLRERTRALLDDLSFWAKKDAEAVEHLTRACAPTLVIVVPRLDKEVHDLPSLAHTAQHLLGEG
ncbi:MAG: ArsA family ATPase [Myxococcaceae bacterium]